MIAPHRLRLYRDSEVKEIPPPEWQIEGILQTRRLAQLFGCEGSLKSFLATSMAYSVAHGVPWAGRDVRQGSVVYLYMEGGDSIQDRRDAWKTANGFALDDDADVFFLAETLNMVDDAGNELEELVDSIEADVGEEGPQLIIVDTLQRAFGGKDPNTPKDMNLFVSRCDYLREHFNSTVLVIHHTGWDESREANARNLRNSCDTVLRVSRSAQALDVKLSFVKQRGARLPEPVRVEFREVSLRHDRSSLALPMTAKLGPSEERDLRALETLALMRNATFTEWRDQCDRRGIGESTFKRDLKAFKKDGLVTLPPRTRSKGFEYSLTTSGRDALRSSGYTVPLSDLSQRGGPSPFEESLSRLNSNRSHYP